MKHAKFNIFSIFFVISLLLFSHSVMANCTSPAAGAGAMDYFTAENTFKFCDGTNWVSMSGGGGGGGIFNNSQEFLASGTLNVPTDVTSILVKVVGSGGGGGGGASGFVGGNGGAGGMVLMPLDVVSESAHVVTIGALGLGAPNSTSAGFGAGTTFFGTLISITGGGGGLRGRISTGNGAHGAGGASTLTPATLDRDILRIIIGNSGSLSGPDNLSYGSGGQGGNSTGGGDGSAGFIKVWWATP